MSRRRSIAFCERSSPTLHGAPLMSNAAHLRGSAQWIRFPRVVLPSWVHWLDGRRARVPVVLLGDAAHTAHFSIGSGSKLALEDAIALDAALAAWTDASRTRRGPRRTRAYQAERSVEVLKLQNAARNSTEWFEHVDRYAGLAPEQFAYSLLTRSQRISHENLRVRDPGTSRRSSAGSRARAGRDIASRDDRPRPPPMLTPLHVRGLTLPNRVVVSPMAQYTAHGDGAPSDWHFVHLGARASGGAGLVMTEMTCVAPTPASRPWCPGLWNDRAARCLEAHRALRARRTRRRGSACSSGTPAPRAPPRSMWEGIDQPLPEGGGR
jgi:anthraniloyl-CoA monooxygenase